MLRNCRCWHVVSECDPSYTTCEADIVACCHVDMPCKRFDAAIKDMSLEKLLFECGWGNIKHLIGMIADTQFRATAKCDQQAKAVDPEHHCWLPKMDAGHNVSIGVPVYSPTWWANVALAYLAFGVEGVARMPACRLPAHASGLLVV